MAVLWDMQTKQCAARWQAVRLVGFALYMVLFALPLALSNRTAHGHVLERNQSEVDHATEVLFSILPKLSRQCCESNCTANSSLTYLDSQLWSAGCAALSRADATSWRTLAHVMRHPYFESSSDMLATAGDGSWAISSTVDEPARVPRIGADASHSRLNYARASFLAAAYATDLCSAATLAECADAAATAGLLDAANKYSLQLARFGSALDVRCPTPSADQWQQLGTVLLNRGQRRRAFEALWSAHKMAPNRTDIGKALVMVSNLAGLERELRTMFPAVSNSRHRLVDVLKGGDKEPPESHVVASSAATAGDVQQRAAAFLETPQQLEYFRRLKQFRKVSSTAITRTQSSDPPLPLSCRRCDNDACLTKTLRWRCKGSFEALKNAARARGVLSGV